MRQFAVHGSFNEVFTTEANPLGTVAEAANGDKYIFVKAGAPIAKYDACRLQGTAAAVDDVRPTSAVGQAVLGVSQVDVPTGSYFWLTKEGTATAKVTAATPAGSPLVSGAVAGTLVLADATAIAFRPIIALVVGSAAGSKVALS